MAVSVLDLFKVGIGPSSSHTVGPMRAARLFAEKLHTQELLGRTRAIRAELFGSLGATGRGHGSDKAILLGLEGELPEAVDVAAIDARLAKIRVEGRLSLLGNHPIEFREPDHLVLHRRRSLPFHPNGMQFTALAGDGAALASAIYYSVGGGFVVADGEAAAGPLKPDAVRVALPFSSAAELLDRCTANALPVSAVMAENEKTFRAPEVTREKLLSIWKVMQECVARGCATPGTLPGGFRVRRRAPELLRQLEQTRQAAPGDTLATLDWISLYAIAVNEENAAGGRVVTAPTNGAAGIIPAVLHYYTRFCPGADDAGVVRFLLVAGAIGLLYKENASLSGADVGCQGEVGVACSMAAAALAEVTGGTPQQVENAAEIAMEHHLGLTCDPVGGLVQIPCIERNAIAAVKAVSAARLALLGDGRHTVSLDKVIKTMRETGADMKTKYKETARGGLALNIVEVPVSLPQC